MDSVEESMLMENVGMIVQLNVAIFRIHTAVYGGCIMRKTGA